MPGSQGIENSCATLPFLDATRSSARKKFLPESVKFLVQRGRDVMQIRRIASRFARGTLDGVTGFFLAEERVASKKGSVAQLFSMPWLPGTLMLWVTYFMGLVRSGWRYGGSASRLFHAEPETSPTPAKTAPAAASGSAGQLRRSAVRFASRGEESARRRLPHPPPRPEENRSTWY